MNLKLLKTNILSILLALVALFVFLSPDIAEARRGGGSFGGSRGGRSFSRSTPSRSPSRSAQRSQSRQSSSPSNKAIGKGSFGGSRLGSKSDYTGKYGTPRKSTPMTRPAGNGSNVNYNVHSYGGYGSGLMMGYMMGSTSWMWGMPFHPAFYYSRPYEVVNPDGSVDVYPPTFNWSKLFFTLIVLAIIFFAIRSFIRSRRAQLNGDSQSSFV